MSIPSRNVTITGVFAEDATTTIPETPIPGTSYRDNTMTESDITKGFPFKTIVDSSQFNQALYEYSSITKMQEKYGFVPWSSLTDYETGSVCLGTNGVLYQAKQPTGPSSTSYDPVNDTSGTYWGAIVLGGGLQIGDVGIAALGIDETLNRRRYLNGQIISQTQFVSFTTFVKNAIASYPSLGTTEALWQQAVTDSDLGQCGQFVVDDVNGTIRLPKVVNIQGLQTLSGNLGTTISAGVPNIEGEFSCAGMSIGTQGYTASGAFTHISNSYTGSDGYGSNSTGLGFDASQSNSIYGNSTTVQAEAVQYPYFIQVATGGETDIDVTTEIQLSNPFFFGMYQWFQTDPNNASWLEANGAYNAKTVYPSYYDWLLSIYNDTGSITGFNVKDTTDTYTNSDFVLNLNDETFRLPLEVDGEPASTTDMLLYFYVGAVVQDADVINAAGIINDVSNMKADVADLKSNAMGAPDYSAGVDITASVANGYTATSNLWINALCEKNASENSTATITINNTEYNVAYTSNNNQWQESNTVSLLLSNGDTLKTNSTNANWTITAFPLKGV